MQTKRIYYHMWASFNQTNIDTPLKDYDNGRDLIYGDIMNYDEFKEDPSKYMLKFINKEYDINKFKYLKNNPIYGDSYGTTMMDLTKCLIKQIDLATNTKSHAIKKQTK